MQGSKLEFMSKKVWIVGDKIYQNEGFFLKKMKSLSNNDWNRKKAVKVFELVEESTCGEWFDNIEAEKSRNERNLQLSKVLGEVDNDLANRLKLIEEACNNNIPGYIIQGLENAKFDKDKFSKFVKSHSEKLIRASVDVEWHKLLLSIYSFRGYRFNKYWATRPENEELIKNINAAYVEAKKLLKAKK